MPRVKFVKKARKDNPVTKAGGSYYWWKFRYSGKQYSLTPPRQSQLTQSDKKSRAFAAQESVEDAFKSFNEGRDIDDLVSMIEDAANEAREVADEYRESADAVREHFGDTSNTDEMDEKADNLETYADELDNMGSEVTNYDMPDEDDYDLEDEDNTYEDDLETWVSEVSGHDGDADLDLY